MGSSGSSAASLTFANHASRSCSVFAISFTFELRGTFLQKGAHAFAEVCGAAGLALHLTLEVQLLFISVVGALPIEPPNQAERDGRSAREVARKLLRFANQLRIVEHSVDEAPLEGLLGRQLLTE